MILKIILGVIWVAAIIWTANEWRKAPLVKDPEPNDDLTIEDLIN